MTARGKARLGFVGAGWWATANHLPLLAQRDDVELAAVCRLGRDELRRVQGQFGFPFATESAEELVNHPGLDGVVVSSPNALHFEHARLALERGLHVLCEKPMCTRGEDARELLQVPGVARLVGFNGSPAAMPSIEIEAIRASLVQGVPVQPHPYFVCGQPVSLRSGPLAGLTGILVRQKSKARFIISLELIQRSVAVELDEADLVAER